MRAKWTVAIALAVLVAGARIGRAANQGPLPAFTVFAADGTAVTSTQLQASDQWLLVYVMPGCQTCDSLLTAMKHWQIAQLPARTVMLVGAQPADAKAYVQRSLPTELSALPWYADAKAQAWNGLQLTGTPVLVGVKKGQIQWAISGVLNDPSSLQSVVTTWVGQ